MKKLKHKLKRKRKLKRRHRRKLAQFAPAAPFTKASMEFVRLLTLALGQLEPRDVRK